MNTHERNSADDETAVGEPINDGMTVPLAPRAELFTDPGARAVWAAVRELEPGLQHEVHRQLGDLLAVAGWKSERPTSIPQRVQRAVSALREAADLLEAEGKPRRLGLETFRRLREENPDRGWPADGTVRRWCGGGWNDALRRAQLEPVPDGDVLVKPVGGAFSREELLEAIQQYVKATGDRFPALLSYLAWAKRPEVKRLPGRRPLSVGPFDREFGGWPRAADKAGLEARVRGTMAKAVPDVTAAVSRWRHVFSDEDVYAALREMAARVDGPFTVKAYMNERQRAFEEDQRSGRPLRPIPSIGTVRARHPIWADALAAAGLPPVDRSGCMKGRSGGHLQLYDDEHLLAALRRAHAAANVEGRLSTKAYAEWRRKTLLEAGREGRFEQLPSQALIEKRFHGFTRALREAFAPAEASGDG